jgi:nucleolar protein 6
LIIKQIFFSTVDKLKTIVTVVGEMAEQKKLTKKQKKALEFRDKKKSKQNEDEIEQENVMNKKKHAEFKQGTKKRKSGSEEEKQKEEQETETEDHPVSKRQKKEKNGPTLILFVGNLPYACSEQEIQDHFKAVLPITVRPRKGFAFVQFEGDGAARRLNVALRMHHTMFKDRKINVELTAGGGGNSSTRRKKLQEKNEKLKVEQAERIRKEEQMANSEEKAEKQADNVDSAPAVHPSRQRMISS